MNTMDVGSQDGRLHPPKAGGATHPFDPDVKEIKLCVDKRAPGSRGRVLIPYSPVRLSTLSLHRCYENGAPLYR